MAIEVKELATSREVTLGNSPTATLQYYISGTAFEGEALTELYNNTGPFYSVENSVLNLESREVSPIGDPTESLKWLGTVTYTKADSKETGESSFAFDTGGQSEKMLTSLKTVYSEGLGGDAPDMKQTIGVTRDGVQGVDILVPTYTFSETHYLPLADVTQAYKLDLRDLTGTVNNAPFKGFSAGEVRFDGASGNQRGNENWEISYRFSVRENVTNDERFPDFSVSHKGWEYVWASFKEDVSEEGGKKFHIMKPTAVYVEKVYRTKNFSKLGI